MCSLNSTPRAAARSRAWKPCFSVVSREYIRTELRGQVQIDLVEVGPRLHDVHMRVQVGDVDAPGERPLDLGPAFRARVRRVDPLERELGRRREEALFIVKRSAVGQAAPAIAALFAGQRQVHAGGKALEHRGRLARPWTRDYQRSAGGNAIDHGPEGGDVGAVAQA